MRETFVRLRRERPQRVVSENYVRANGDAARASRRSTAVSQTFYVGGNLGVSNTQTGETMTHSADAAYGFTAGYQFTKNLGVEGFYERAGQFSGVNAAGNASGDGRANAFGVMGVGTINVYKAFSLYGKLGVANTKTSETGNSAFGSINLDATRNSLTYGVGAQYDITPSIYLRLGWDSYGEAHHGFQFSPATGNVVGGISNFHTNVYSLTAMFRF